MTPAQLVTVPGLDDVPSEDWMISCDNCGLGVRADERFRGSGLAGRSIVRGILSDAGWSHEAPDADYCPACTGNAARDARWQVAAVNWGHTDAPHAVSYFLVDGIAEHSQFHDSLAEAFDRLDRLRATFARNGRTNEDLAAAIRNSRRETGR